MHRIVLSFLFMGALAGAAGGDKPVRQGSRPPPAAPGLVGRTRAAFQARIRAFAGRLRGRDAPKAVAKDPLKERAGDLYIRLMHDFEIDHETFRTANDLRHRAEELIWDRGSRSKRADEARRLLDQADEVIDEPIRRAMSEWQAAHGTGTQVAREDGLPSEVRWEVDGVNATIRKAPENAPGAVRRLIDRYRDDERPAVQKQVVRLREMAPTLERESAPPVP